MNELRLKPIAIRNIQTVRPFAHLGGGLPAIKREPARS